MDQTVVTIYCCGTGEHRDKLTNTVPYTWRATAGNRVWMNDGAGNMQHYILKSEKILKKVEGGAKKVKGFSKHHTTWFDNLSGISTQDNIINSLQWLWMEYYRQDKPAFKTVNLCGWSRGAVTCIMLAHAIEAAGFRGLIPDLKVNIFAIDPVPGLTNDFGSGGSFEKTGRAGTPYTLPRCVNQYAAVLAENVGGAMGTAFRNVSPTFAIGGGGVKSEYPLPGSHSNVAKMDNVVGDLAASLCHKFMAQHGTTILVPKVMSDPQELEQYARILLEHGRVKTSGLINKKKEFKKWGVASMRAGPVANAQRGHKFYVNDHHFALMKSVLPRVAGYMAGTSPLPSNEIDGVRQRFPQTYAAMGALGYVDAPEPA